MRKLHRGLLWLFLFLIITAGVVFLVPATRWWVLGTLRGEPFQVLSGWVAHEALHQDNTFTLQEEQAAEAFGTLAIAQQAQTDASFISAGTTLVNRENVFLLALLNSGRTIWPYPGVLNAPMLGAQNGVFPGQKAATEDATPAATTGASE